MSTDLHGQAVEVAGAVVSKRKPRKRDLMTEGDETDTQEATSTKKRKPHSGEETMKKKHNITSQKGRAKINVEIGTLKELLPECREMVQLCKASILHCAVNTLRKLTTAVDSAAEQQAKLNSEINRLASFNQQILDELNVYRVEKGLPPVQNLPSRDPVSTPTTVIMSPKSEPDSDDTTSMMTSNALDELLSFESGDSVIEDLCSPTKAVTPQPEQSDHDYIEPAAYLSSDYGLKTATYEAYDPLVIPTQYTSFETNQQFVIQQHHLAAPQSNHLYNFGLFAILFFMLPYALGVGESAGEITTLASRSLLSISTSYIATPWIGLVVLVALLIAIWAAAGLAWAFAPKQVAIVPSPATIKQNTLMNKVFGLSMSIHEPSGLTTKLLSK